MTNKKKTEIKYRVGDVVAILLSMRRYAYGRILNNHYLAIYDALTEGLTTEVDWSIQPIKFYTAYFDSAVCSGEWPIVAHCDSQSPDDDWAPAMCIRNVFPPHNVKYIVDRGEHRPATDEEAVGLEKFSVRYPIGVIQEIERRFGLLREKSN